MHCPDDAPATSRRAKEQQAVERRRKCPHATVKVLVCSARRHEADTNPCTGRSRVTHAAGPRRRVERPLHTEGASHQAPKQATLLDQLQFSQRATLSLIILASDLPNNCIHLQPRWRPDWPTSLTQKLTHSRSKFPSNQISNLSHCSQTWTLA